MCRKVVFRGTCPHCSKTFTWDELSQELSCLEAKNNGVFGMCSEGTEPDEKPHDQECDACAAELEADEGYDGGTEDVQYLKPEVVTVVATGGWYGDGYRDGYRDSDGQRKDAADGAQDSGKHRNKKQRTT